MLWQTTVLFTGCSNTDVCSGDVGEALYREWRYTCCSLESIYVRMFTLLCTNGQNISPFTIPNVLEILTKVIAECTQV